MNDLELTKACAEAMGYQHRDDNGQLEIMEQRRDRHEWRLYDPLNRDAQAMALLKRFEMNISGPYHRDTETWRVVIADETCSFNATSTDLNRAICECAATMQGKP